MIELGKKQDLEVVKTTDFGVYLNEPRGREDQKVLLPKSQTPKDTKLGDTINVFIYKDSEDRPIATTLEPNLKMGEIALLKVIDISSIGAFLDWGLAKDLFLPFKEQTVRVHLGDEVLVSLYIDKSSRLCATMNVYEYLSLNSPYKKDDRVIGTVYETSDEFGAFVAVDNLYSALIPKKELYRSLKPGDSVEARIIEVKDDGKLTLSIREKAYVQIDSDSQLIYDRLSENDGFLPFHDKSDSEEIKNEFGMSKNAFKRAIGHLFKDGKIVIEENGIRITP